MEAVCEMSISSLLLEEKKAMLHVQEARKKANEILAKAKAEADQILKSVLDEKRMREMLEEFEAEIKREAETIAEDYRKKAEELRRVGERRLEEAAELIRKEVLTHDI